MWKEGKAPRFWSRQARAIGRRAECIRPSSRSDSAPGLYRHCRFFPAFVEAPFSHRECGRRAKPLVSGRAWPRLGPGAPRVAATVLQLARLERDILGRVSDGLGLSGAARPFTTVDRS